MICDAALDMAAEKIVQRIRVPSDDPRILRRAARAWLLEQMDAEKC